MTQLALTIIEVAKAVSVGRSKVFEEIREGRLKAIKVGRSTRVSLGDLQAWLESRPVVVPKPCAQPDPNGQRRGPLAFPKPTKINDRIFSPDKSGGELVPDGKALVVGQKRRRPVARGEPHVAQLGEARPHVALPTGKTGIGASRKQGLTSKRAGRSRARAS
jgi:excisionase family DNA binding protein